LQTKIAEMLGGSGYNTERLATPYIPQITGLTLNLRFKYTKTACPFFVFFVFSQFNIILQLRFFFISGILHSI